jgi:hypothetical protein
VVRVYGPQTSLSRIAVENESGFNFEVTGFVIGAFLAIAEDWKNAVAGFFACRFS